MNQVNVTVRFHPTALVGNWNCIAPEWHVGVIADELKIARDIVSFDEDHCVITVTSLDELFQLCGRFDPAVYVSVQFEQNGNSLSMTLDD